MSKDCTGCVDVETAQVQQQTRQANRVAAQLDVCVRYVGGESSVRPFYAHGVLKHFGNTDLRREGTIPAWLASEYLEESGRFFGQFEKCAEEGVEEAGDGETADNPDGDGEAGDSPDSDGEVVNDADGNDETADSADGDVANDADGETADSPDGDDAGSSRSPRRRRQSSKNKEG